MIACSCYFPPATLVEIARISCKPPRHLHVHIDFFLLFYFWLLRRGFLVSQSNERRFNLCRDREDIERFTGKRTILLHSFQLESFASFSFYDFPGFFDRVLTTARSILWKTLDGILFRWKIALIILQIDKLLKENIFIYNMKYF